MEKKNNSSGSYFKDIIGYVIMTVFSLCIAIGMYNSNGFSGFVLFAAAATAVGVIMIVITLKKSLTKKTYEPEAPYEPGPWLQEFDKGRKNSRKCPNCGSILGRGETVCYKCRTVVPLELEENRK